MIFIAAHCILNVRRVLLLDSLPKYFFTNAKGLISMKKLFTKILTSALLFSCLLTGCTGAGTGNETSMDTTTDDSSTTMETTEQAPAESKTLSTVQIVAGESAVETKAATELQKYLEGKGITVTEDGFPIYLEIDEAIGADAYNIVSDLGANEKMTISGGNGRGLLYGVYGFLEQYADCRYFTPDLERCEVGEVTIPHGTLCSYVPTFETRAMNWYYLASDADWCVKNGISRPRIALSEEYGDYVNYGDYHAHTLGKLTETGDWSSPNPCLTDPKILEKTIANVRKALQEDPTIDILSVSQNDNTEYCKCANCAAIDEEEGSPAGTLLRFVNAVAADIAEDYPNVTIDMLAYRYTQKAPSVTKPLENVCIRLCSIFCDFTHPLNTSENDCTESQTFSEDLIAWSKICDNIYIWDYTTNFHFYIATFANFHVLRENMRFFAEHNVRGMFPQGNGCSLSGEFGELRAYLVAKLMMNPYMSEEEYYAHMDEFMEAYYGEGWSYLRAYINDTSELASIACQGIYDQPFTAIREVDYKINEGTFTEYWDKAEELAGDRLPEVQRSRLQWKYIQLMLHPGKEAAKRLIDEVENYYKIAWREGRFAVRPTSDLGNSPHLWYYGNRPFDDL